VAGPVRIDLARQSYGLPTPPAPLSNSAISDGDQLPQRMLIQFSKHCPVAAVVGTAVPLAILVHRVAWRLQIPKIDDVCACSAATRVLIREWMVPGDSGHRIGVVRHPLSPADCSKSLSMGDILLQRDSKFRKLRMSVPVAQQPGI